MAFSSTFDPTPSTTTVQGASVSNREDLMDILTILAPEETPVLSSAAKSKANSTFVEWTVDSLAAPVTTGISEGADVTSFTDKFASRARLGNSHVKTVTERVNLSSICMQWWSVLGLVDLTTCIRCNYETLQFW